MRINLDDNGSEETSPQSIVLEDDGEDERPDANPDELVIRRDQPLIRHRRRRPKPLTVAQQRVLTGLLVVVIIVAVFSLGVYWRNTRDHAQRIPLTTRPSASGAASPSSQVRQPPVQPGPPVYQGPPPRNSEPLSDQEPEDTGQSDEGIH